jgi:hypothetical protein
MLRAMISVMARPFAHGGLGQMRPNSQRIDDFQGLSA